MADIHENLKPALAELLLSIADDKLMLGTRDSDWTGLGPILEEDIAFSSLSQDEIGHASALYQMIAPWRGGNADKLAFGRAPQEYRCAAITVASDDFDWAVAIVRQFFCDHCDIFRLARLAKSGYAPLASLGGRLVAEERIHVDHSDAWIARLARGTDESRAKIQSALDRLAPLAPMLLEETTGVRELETAGVYPSLGHMFGQWKSAVERVATQAGLRLSVAPPAAGAAGGRQGRHAAEFGPLLEEMTAVYRLEPDAAW